MNERQMQGLRDIIDECGFVDLGFRGLSYSWCNNRLGATTSWVQLDRAMATNEWMLLHKDVIIHHLDSSASDHKPLWINLSPVAHHQQRRKPFRFEDMWQTYNGCEPIITDAWQSQAGPHQ